MMSCEDLEETNQRCVQKNKTPSSCMSCEDFRGNNPTMCAIPSSVYQVYRKNSVQVYMYVD